MHRPAFAALLLGLLAASPTAAADWPMDTFAPLLQTMRGSAEALAGTGQDLAARTVALAEDSAGPGSAFVEAVLAAAGPIGRVGAQVQDEFVAVGGGSATAFVHSTNGDIHGACADMRAVVEYHVSYFSENPMYFDILGGQGTPTMLCATGFRGALQPGEVQGDLRTGLVGTSRSIDANIDLWLGPVRPDATRAFWVRQVTYPGPGGINDVLEFNGTVVEAV